jgi:hypothetical protein
MPRPPSIPKGYVRADEALRMILDGTAPDELRVAGTLTIRKPERPIRLPRHLTVNCLELESIPDLERLPETLAVRRLSLAGNWNPSRLLEGLRCYDLSLAGTSIESIPASLRVSYRLDLESCTALGALPAGLKVGSLVLRNCISLGELPEHLNTYFLDISGCTAIEAWPAHAAVSVGRFAARGCAQIRELPPWLVRVAQLDLRDCTNLSRLPEGMLVSSWIDVAGTGITSLPRSLYGVQIRWRGVPVDARIAFLSETITSREILDESNAEKRRVMLERMGYEKFLAHAQGETLDEDHDAGGPRRLVKVPMAGDEDLVCVSVFCPSTGRQYVLRVPPGTATCHQAAAWVAGFDNPDDYQPLIET